MGKTEKQDIRIDVRLLIAAALLVAVLLGCAVFVAPKYGSVFAAYREQHAAYKAASADLKAAQQENADLSQNLAELQELDKQASDTRDEVFKLAAQLEQDIADGKTDRRICYLTFDDGPYNRGKKFLEILHKYDIKATFFLSTANGNKLPDQADITAESQYPEYVKYGHTIGNHTYSHNYSADGIYKNAETFLADVRKQEEFTEKAANGYKTRIVRFPGGTGNAGAKLESIEDALRKEGYGWINWTVDSGDSAGGDKVTASSVKSSVLGAAKDQKIMVPLFHEWSQKSLEALPEIIETLDSQGYIFLPLFPESMMVEH